MLYEFLLKNKEEILAITEKTSLDLAGIHPSSVELKQGLPIFYEQLLNVLRLEQDATIKSTGNKADKAKDADEEDEPALANADGCPEEAELARTAGLHGVELLRLGYTLSHVVHAYGAMCQAITSLATKKDIKITPNEFHDLNRCLDVAIAGAVTEYQSLRNTQEMSREVKHLGFLAHELRNALSTVNISLQLIKRGTVGFQGNTGQVLERGLKRLEDLIDRSLTEVRLRVDPQLNFEPVHLLQLVDQIVMTAEVIAHSRKQRFSLKIDPALILKVDQQLFYSALSNLIQNALKYSHTGSEIQIRGKVIGDKAVIEIEDECGGLTGKKAEDLFKPYEQQNEDRGGLGLGLTIARQAIEMNHGTIGVSNLPGKGCIFRITLPQG